MVKIFTQKIDFTNSSTIQRDSTTLEIMVNTFIQQPGTQPKRTDFFEFITGGSTYYSILLDYDIKKNS